MIINEQQLTEIIPQLFVIPGGISVATDRTCKEILHNRTAAKFLRIPEGGNFSMSADNPPQVKTYDVHGVELTAEDLPIQQSACYGKEASCVLELVWEDGVRKIAVWNAKPIFSEQGEIIGAVATSEDITEYVFEDRRLRSEREQLRVELERLDRLNHVSQLAAGISHEVRNPLTTIKGFLQLMRTKKQYTKDADVIGMMIDELNRANEIISDFLSLTKDHEKQLSRGNILDVIGRIFPLLENDAFIARKKLVVRRITVSDIMMDSKEIKQIILNLVQNAIEATPVGGHIYLETFENRHSVGFTVIDEGEGIPKEVMKKLGTPFFTTKANGTGVGLSICYDIAKRHNGVIDVVTSSKGTVFSVEFPKLKD